MQLEALALKSKPAANNRLTGRSVELPNDPCKCGSNTAIIDGDRRLSCRSCGRQRGWLSKSTANWIAEVAARFGAPEIITIRGPKL
jgi:hypothetical protein